MWMAEISISSTISINDTLHVLYRVLFQFIESQVFSMDFLRGLFSKRNPKTRDTIPSYDVPFARPAVHRVIIPPKPSNLVGRPIAPRATRPVTVSIANEISVADSADQSVILFGSPLPSIKTVDTVSTGVRYPTNVLFPSPRK